MKLVLTMSSFRTTYRVQGGAIKNHERYFLNNAAHLQRTIWDGEHRGNTDFIESQCCRFFFELTRALAFAMFERYRYRHIRYYAFYYCARDNTRARITHRQKSGHRVRGVCVSKVQLAVRDGPARRR